MSLQVEDTCVEKNDDGEIVDFIFLKDASKTKYDSLLGEDKNKTIPDCVKHLISDGFIKKENISVRAQCHLVNIK